MNYTAYICDVIAMKRYTKHTDMTQTITNTTGTVKGINEVKDFIKMCNSKFSKVHKVDISDKIEGYLQYTLLTNNEIRLYY